MLRRTALLLTAALTAGGAAVAAPQATAGSRAKAPVVAVIDTGVRATHKEFDYRGRTSTTDQFVAWFDFTAEKKGSFQKPSPGQLWDSQVREPYDGYGHGTLTASMVGGRNVSAEKTPSAYPGAKLAIARVGRSDGTIETAVMPDAIRWAVDSVRADVISMSIGQIVPAPATLNRDVYDAIAYARSKGVLFVVSNGNGFGNVGLVPGDPGWASGSSGSPDALTVGAQGSTALFNSTDPEVASVYGIKGPSTADDSGYVDDGGTSFGAPYVAGFAAAVLLASRQGGHPLSRDALEQFVKDSATDSPLMPPTFEGYGVLGAKELAVALDNARAGKAPSRPSPDTSALYVDGVIGTLRLVWVTGT